MIPKADIVAWLQFAPWVTDAQVEQDLIICRALVTIFQSHFLADRLAFRGGTALHKLYFDIPLYGLLNQITYTKILPVRK